MSSQSSRSQPSAYDVVIIGGAIVGSAVAYFLMAEGPPDLKVLVVEKDPSYARASTSLSLSSIRVQFSTPQNIAMSRFGVSFLREAAERLAIEGDRPEIPFHERGYLILAPEAGVAALEANHAVQKMAGAEVALLAPDELKARFPWLSTEGVAMGSLGLKEEGWFDASLLMQALRKKAAALGAEYRRDSVVGLDVQAGRVAAVDLAEGGRIAAGAVVNAAGPFAAEVAAMAGVDLPVRPRKRSVFMFDCRQAIPDMPLVVDTTGVYVRPEGDGFLTGWSPPEEEDEDCADLEVEWPLFEERLWPALAHRIPAFEAIKQTGAWAGHYAVNTVDHNAILGASEAVADFYLANGFSGHGVQQAPAVGRGLAELILYGEYRSLDLSVFAPTRFEAGRPIREINVI